MGDDVVVGDGARVSTTPPAPRQAQESQEDPRRRGYPPQPAEIERYREQREELEDLLERSVGEICFQRGPEQEMVAQDMAQSYAHLLHQPPSREHQQEEFISLDELQSRIHQDNRGGGGGHQVSAILSAADPYQQQQQQGSYYSLSAVQE